MAIVMGQSDLFNSQEEIEAPSRAWEKNSLIDPFVD